MHKSTLEKRIDISFLYTHTGARAHKIWYVHICTCLELHGQSVSQYM